MPAAPFWGDKAKPSVLVLPAGGFADFVARLRTSFMPIFVSSASKSLAILSIVFVISLQRLNNLRRRNGYEDRSLGIS